MKITSAKITGIPDTQGLTLAHDNLPTDSSLVQNRGRLIILVAAPFTQAREILDKIIKNYYEDKASSSYYALKQAVEKVFAEGVEIAATALTYDKVAIVAAGGAQVALLRSGMLAKLLVSGTKDLISASGVALEGDTLLEASSHLFKDTPEGVLKAALQQGTSQEVIESLAPAVESANNSRLGAVVVKFASDKVINSLVETMDKRVSSPRGAALRMKVAGFLDRILATIPERKIFIKSGAVEFEAQKKKNVAVLVGVILIFLLVVSIAFGIRQRGINLARSKYESRLQEAEHQFTESKSLAEIDPARARELILAAKSTLETIKNEGVDDPELEILIADVKKEVGKIAGIYEVPVEHFLDLSLLSSGMKGDSLSFSDGRMLVLDKNGERLVEITVETKKTKVLAGPETLSAPTQAAAYADRSFILADTGVTEIDDEENLVIERNWGENSLFYAFFGNIYVLDREESEIYRFAGDKGEFGTKQNWFGPGVSPDLTQVIAWTIDGSVWLLDENGKILRFTRGSPEAFSIKGLGGDLMQSKALYSSDTSDYLYILDSEGKKVVVVKKDGGEFKAEYLVSEAEGTTDLIVSEEDKKIILLAGEKLYSIELKHLD